MRQIFYELALGLGLLGYVPRAFARKRLPHPGWRMRLGNYPDAVRARLRSPGAIWVHAVSVGEVMAVQPLIRKLLEASPSTPLVLSTVTPSGYEVASRVMAERAVVLYAPLDFRRCVRRALDVIQPRIVVLVESELWPTWIRLAHQRGIPVAVVNGRISERAYRRYWWIKPLLRQTLALVDEFLMQTEADATRVIGMGAPATRVQVLGSLKWDASLATRPPSDVVEHLARRLNLGPVHALIVAGSTHRGEEETLLQALCAIRAQVGHARLVIAPRHRERVGEVEALIRGHGLAGRRVSELDGSPHAWDVAIVDTMGELPLYYALASVVFVGGSLVPHGGQNPLEPASLGRPVVFGPFMNNFAEISQRLLASRAARQLVNAGELSQILQDLLTDRAQAQAMGRRAQDLTERFQGAAQRTLDALRSLLTHPAPTT